MATEQLQVKMFVHADPRQAEKAVANWLKEHPVCIHHVAQSQSEKGGHFVFVLSVFYEEGAKGF
jgi:hypothetical protein